MATAPGSTAYVRLEEADFKKLVAGEHVSLLTADGRAVEILLADIGWGRIQAAVEQAYRRSWRPRDDDE